MKNYNKKETTYRKDGSVSSESYRIDGKRHRVDGPAYIDYYEDGSVRYEGYYIDDKYYTKEEWKTKTTTCSGKVVEIDGIKYKLTEVQLFPDSSSTG